MEFLPSEVLVHILDDPGLTIADLAMLSRVSRRWHEAIIPRLYEQYTFRFYTRPDQSDESSTKLPSFAKYGEHVKSLSFHPRTWTSIKELKERSAVETDSDVAKALDVLNNFPNLKSIEYYETCGMGWTDFWIIFNYFLNSKPKLVHLSLRRYLPYSTHPPSEAELTGINFHSPEALPDLRSIALRITTRTLQPLQTLPFFLKSLQYAIGDACRDVSAFSTHIRLFKAEKDWRPSSFLSDEQKIKLEKIRDLSFNFLEAVTFPSWHVFHYDPSKVEILRIPCNEFETGNEDLRDETQLETSAQLRLGSFANLRTLVILDQWAQFSFYQQDIQRMVLDFLKEHANEKLQWVVLDDYGVILAVSHSNRGSMALELSVDQTTNQDKIF